MPCPLFEPQRRVAVAADINMRLPLLFEFAGICHAGEAVVDAAHRIRYCNHGNARGHCSSFPEETPVSAVRFHVTNRTDCSLEVQVVEEQNYWPLAWSRFEYVIFDGRLVPEIEDVCRRAQVFHFCRSYLDKFAHER